MQSDQLRVNNQPSYQVVVYSNRDTVFMTHKALLSSRDILTPQRGHVVICRDDITFTTINCKRKTEKQKRSSHTPCPVTTDTL